MGDELQARIRVRELQNTGNNSCVSCLGWRWHRGKKTVFMPRCSSAQRSVASAWREKLKQVVSRVRGVCDDVTCPFLHSGVVQILKAGQVHTNDPFCCPNSPLQWCVIDSVINRPSGQQYIGVNVLPGPSNKFQRGFKKLKQLTRYFQYTITYYIYLQCREKVFAPFQFFFFFSLQICHT